MFKSNTTKRISSTDANVENTPENDHSNVIVAADFLGLIIYVSMPRLFMLMRIFQLIHQLQLVQDINVIFVQIEFDLLVDQEHQLSVIP
jgi:hypothetical protein